MRPDVTRWLDRRTSVAADWSLAELLAAKGSTRVSVVLPALNEAATIGAIVSAIVTDLVSVACPLVDEVVVMDSGSTDQTAAVAAAAGARVVPRHAVLPEVAPVTGKGEVLWRSLAATTGDVVVFVDADLEDFSSSTVSGLLGPLLLDDTVLLVKGFYDRPLRDGDSFLANGGGRVTELVARPLLNLHWPELAGIIQPLVGEYAARRRLARAAAVPHRVRRRARRARRHPAVGGVGRHRPGRPRGPAPPAPGRARAGPDGRRDLADRAAPPRPGRAAPYGRTASRRRSRSSSGSTGATSLATTT